MEDWQGGLEVKIAVDKAISIFIMWILIQLISVNKPSKNKIGRHSLIMLDETGNSKIIN